MFDYILYWTTKIRLNYLVLGPSAKKKHFGYRVANHGYLFTSFQGQDYMLLVNVITPLTYFLKSLLSRLLIQTYILLDREKFFFNVEKVFFI